MPDDSRFHFPEEIQRLLECAVGGVFGFMEVGGRDGVYNFLKKIESAIHNNTEYKHGKDAFTEDSYPYLAPRHLLIFGRMWLRTALDRALKDSDARKDLSHLNLGSIASTLEDAAKRCRELEKLIKKEKKPRLKDRVRDGRK